MAVFTLFSLVFAFIAHSAAPASITVGFNPAENSQIVETNGKLLSEYFKKKTGLEVKTFVPTDYTALIEAMRSGKVDFAFLPPSSLVMAEKIADAKVLLKVQRNGKSVFYSAIIVRADRGINKLEDLRGKNIAWVDPSSASGSIVPKASLITKKKIDPDSFFGKQVYAGSHDAVVLAVLNGTVDAGATFVNDTKGEDGAWHLFLKKDSDKKKIRMIYVSDAYPNDTIATTNAFQSENKELVKKIVSTLTEMSNNEEGKKILTALYKIDSMVPATSKEYQPLRDAAKTVGIK